MSVTFRIEGAPHHVEYYECQCVQNGAKWPDCTMCNPDGRCGISIDDWPSLNVANMTAEAMFRCLSLPYDCGGSWTLDQLPQIRRKVIEILNLSDGTLRGEEDPINEGRYHYLGIDKERLTHRFQELLALLVAAQEQQHEVCWG